MAKIAKIVGINVFVFFVAGNLLYWSIPAVQAISDQARSWTRKPPAPVRAEAISPAFSADDNAWFPAYAREYAQLRWHYKSYVGWRSTSLAGEAITVAGPHHQRLTVNTGAGAGKKAYFFGGSTMWGAYADNKGTIPSHFAALTGTRAENFAELGWVAHQNLIMLMQLLQHGHRPDLVVFYDGINDTQFHCDPAHPVGAHHWEERINQRLNAEPARPATFAHYGAPVMALAGKVHSELSRRLTGRPDQAARACNADNAEAIAQNLVRDWRFAKQLAEASGARFVGILQPMAYLTRAPKNYLQLSVPRGETFTQIYAAIQKAVAAEPSFHDMTAALDGPQSFYIDDHHLTPQGNHIVARKIADIAMPMLR